MIDNIYIINKKKLYVYCEIKEYCQQLNNWLSTYDVVSTQKYNSYIMIFSDKVVWNTGNGEKSINKVIKQTDLYPLFYNVIANIILDNSDILLHSAVFCYNNKGVLVVGDFNSGKTALCLKALKKNMKVISADQTHLSYDNNKMIVKQGSSYMKINKNNAFFLEKENIKIEINLIINLVGLCDNGILSFSLINNKDHIIKKMFKFCTWHSDIPLFTTNMSLEIDKSKIKRWLNNIDIPFYDVRGDTEKIILKIMEELR